MPQQSACGLLNWLERMLQQHTHIELRGYVGVTEEAISSACNIKHPGRLYRSPYGKSLQQQQWAGDASMDTPPAGSPC